MMSWMEIQLHKARNSRRVEATPCSSFSVVIRSICKHINALFINCLQIFPNSCATSMEDEEKVE